MAANQTRASNLQIFKIPTPIDNKHQIFVILMTNKDGLCTMVTNERQARELHMEKMGRE